MRAVRWKGEGRIKRALALGMFVASAILLFAGLGHSSLWDDEAINAMHGLGVWRTGDTSAVFGLNIVGYRGGATLVGLRERYTPPLGFYLAAPSLGLLGPTPFAARLPFALCGLGTVIVILQGLKKARADLTVWILMAEALVGNVSFFLYSRQCRYYAAATLATSVLAFLYVFWDGRRRTVTAFALVSVLLLAANYLNYVAFYACLTADYLLWGRKRRSLRAGDWACLIGLQILLGTPIVTVWNPLGKGVVNPEATPWLVEKLTLFWWNWRDMNQCEFGVAILIVLAPLLHGRTRRDCFFRLPLAALIYVASVTTASPQPIGPTTSHADVRYLAPMIPLYMVIGVLCLSAIVTKPIPAILLGMGLFGTNLFQGGPFFEWGLRSTIESYCKELAWPPDDPYLTAAHWINENVPAGSSVWVQPDYMAYSLMFHAPEAIYAWQFELPAAPQFKGLAPIHFRDVKLPDFVIAFGPLVSDLAPKLQFPRRGNFRYERIATLDTYWRGLSRPELFWHPFQSIPIHNAATEAIHVFHRISPQVDAVDGTHPCLIRFQSSFLIGISPARRIDREWLSYWGSSQRETGRTRPWLPLNRENERPVLASACCGWGFWAYSSS